jgi:hypothetical protein
MRAWARRTTLGAGEDLPRIRAIHRELASDGPRGIREIEAPTPSAVEAFTNRRADCVGFALLLAGLGRGLDIDVGFALATNLEQTDETETLRVLRGHLVAVTAGRVFDLGGEAPGSFTQVQMWRWRTCRSTGSPNRPRRHGPPNPKWKKRPSLP